MKKLVFIPLFLTFFSAYTQTDCSAGRYYDPIFPDVDLDFGVLFGENVQPTFLNPNATQQLRMDIYEPQGDIIAQRPLLILAFGGGFVIGDKLSPDIVDLCNRFAKLGYVTASIDYRLTSDLLINSSEENSANAIIKGAHDMKAAIRYFRKDAATSNSYRIDPNQIFIGGVSAGGVLSLLATYIDYTDSIPSYVDTTSIGGIEGLSGNPGYSSAVSGVISLSGATSDPNFIDAGEAPVCCVHGSEDNIVPFGTAMVNLFGINQIMHGGATIDDRATNIGITSSFKPFYGAGHTPFILDVQAGAYMDSTFWVVRDFLYNQICGPITVSEKSIKSKSFSIFPNPASNVAIVQTDAKGVLEILNLQGKTLVQLNLFNNKATELSLGKLPKGIYSVRFHHLESVETTQLVVH